MSPFFIVAAVFGTMAVLAVFFVCWPILRVAKFGRIAKISIASASAAATLAVGGGLYAWLGSPQLAFRAVSPPRDVSALIAALAVRARQKNFDATGWTLLGRGYLSLGDAVDAAAAFRRAAQMSSPQTRPPLFSAYGEALTMAASGTVTPEAEEAFRAALSGNPKDFAARYYLGLAYAAKGKSSAAILLWKSLLADTPPGAPWRAQLLDHLAALESRSGAAPDIGGMVARLADRLRKAPADPEGWQRLVRAYAVLGETDKARAALGNARTVLKDNPDALTALGEEARALKLE